MTLPLVCFGGFLVVVGLTLGVREIRNPIRLSGLARRVRRRLLGATLLCLLGGLIMQGPLPQGLVTQQQLVADASYWGGVLLLTFTLIGLAFWDTAEGVRALNQHLELAEDSQLRRIQNF